MLHRYLVFAVSLSHTIFYWDTLWISIHLTFWLQLQIQYYLALLSSLEKCAFVCVCIERESQVYTSMQKRSKKFLAHSIPPTPSIPIHIDIWDAFHTLLWKWIFFPLLTGWLADCRHLLGSFPFRGYTFCTRHKRLSFSPLQNEAQRIHLYCSHSEIMWTMSTKWHEDNVLPYRPISFDK